MLTDKFKSSILPILHGVIVYPCNMFLTQETSILPNCLSTTTFSGKATTIIPFSESGKGDDPVVSMCFKINGWNGGLDGDFLSHRATHFRHHPFRTMGLSIINHLAIGVPPFKWKQMDLGLFLYFRTNL